MAGLSARTQATMARRTPPPLSTPFAGPAAAFMFTGSAKGFEIRRIGPGALRQTHRRLGFRGMVFDVVTCTPFAGTGAQPSVKEFRRAR